MNQIIKINPDTKAVSARELYVFLGLDTSNWKRWYEKNITTNEFAVENEDWIELVIMTSSNNGIPTKEFTLSIDFAKKLSMMARTDRGEQARQYFIEVEKAFKAQPTKELSRKEMILLMLEAEEEKERLQQQLGVAAPKAEYYDTVLQSDSLISTTVIASDLGMSAVALNNLLRQGNVIYKQDNTWVLYAKYRGHGYTHSKTHPFNHTDGTVGTRIHTYWTEKGRDFVMGKVGNKVLVISK